MTDYGPPTWYDRILAVIFAAFLAVAFALALALELASQRAEMDLNPPETWAE